MRRDGGWEATIFRRNRPPPILLHPIRGTKLIPARGGMVFDGEGGV
jgi:hypothetical protein